MLDRLYLGFNFLLADGALFTSIDDIEVYNLRGLVNLVYGATNFIDSIIWKKRYGGGAKEKHLVSLHEYILFFARDKTRLDQINVPLNLESIDRYYKLKDEKFAIRGPYRTHPLEATKSVGVRPNLVYPIPAPDGIEIWPERQWWWDKERTMKAIQNNELEFIKGKNGWTVHTKQYLKDENGIQRQGKAFSIIDDVYTQHGTAEISDLFGDSKLDELAKSLEHISL
jgi:adenine-specific DNA-methyltransferase